jgi:hypothetical protein
MSSMLLYCLHELPSHAPSLLTFALNTVVTSRAGQLEDSSWDRYCWTWGQFRSGGGWVARHSTYSTYIACTGVLPWQLATTPATLLPLAGFMSSSGLGTAKHSSSV